METKDVTLPRSEPRILSAASTNGHRVELVECSDGRIVITCDGGEHAVYPRGTSLELCIREFMALLRSDCDGGGAHQTKQASNRTPAGAQYYFIA